MPEVPELSIQIQGETVRVPAQLPLLPIRSTVLFPGTTLPLAVGRPNSVAAVREAAGADGIIALVTQRKPDVERAGREDLYDVGVVARILQIVDTGQGLSVVAFGLARFRLLEFLPDEPARHVRIEVIADALEETAEAEAARRTVQRMAKQLIRLRDDLPDELQEMVDGLDDPARLADLAAFGMNLSTEEKMA